MTQFEYASTAALLDIKRFTTNNGNTLRQKLEEMMAQVFIRQLDEKVVDRLKKRAKEHGRSLESEVRIILEETVPDYERTWKRIEQFHNRLKKSGRKFRDSATLIRTGHS